MPSVEAVAYRPRMLARLEKKLPKLRTADPFAYKFVKSLCAKFDGEANYQLSDKEYLKLLELHKQHHWR